MLHDYIKQQKIPSELEVVFFVYKYISLIFIEKKIQTKVIGNLFRNKTKKKK